MNELELKRPSLRLILVKSSLIAIFAFLPYVPGLNNQFILDDNELILDNPQVRGNKPIREIFLSPFWEPAPKRMNYYRPIVILTYRFDYWLWKTRASGYHLSNFFIHSLVSVLSFILFKRLCRDEWVSLLSALLFAIHPAHTQSVCWISGRTDLLAALFGLSSFYFYIQFKYSANKFRWGWLCLCLFFLALGFLSKESALIFPVLFILWDLTRDKKGGDLFKRTSLIPYLGMFVEILAYLGIRFKVLGNIFASKDASLIYGWYSGGQTDPSRIITVVKIISYYIQTLLYPIHLAFESKLLVSHSWFEPGVIGNALLLMGFIALILLGLSRSPFLSFGGIWFLLFLVPVLNIFPINHLVMEHFLYIPSIGFCLFFSVLAMIARLSISRTRPGIIHFTAIIMILFFFLVLTINRQSAWKDQMTIYQDMVMKAPKRVRSWFLLGNELNRRGDKLGAMRAWIQACKLDASAPENHIALAGVLLEIGRLDEGINELKFALNLDPDNIIAHYNLGIAYELKGETELANVEYQKALGSCGDDFKQLLNLGTIAIKAGKCELAYKAMTKMGNQAPERFIGLFWQRCPR